MELRSATTDFEIRMTAADDLEIRAGDGDKPNMLVGYAIVWNSLSADLGGFRERVLPGAAKGGISANADIRALVSHNPDLLLGRTSNGTLRVAEDERGLRVEIDVPPTSYGRDLMELVKRRDVRAMSFGFRVAEGGQRFVKENGQTIRELTNINVREVSAIANPAYGETSLFVRVDPSVRRHLDQDAARPHFARCATRFRKTVAEG